MQKERKAREWREGIDNSSLVSANALYLLHLFLLLLLLQISFERLCASNEEKRTSCNRRRRKERGKVDDKSLFLRRE